MNIFFLILLLLRTNYLFPGKVNGRCFTMLYKDIISFNDTFSKFFSEIFSDLCYDDFNQIKAIIIETY